MYMITHTNSLALISYINYNKMFYLCIYIVVDHVSFIIQCTIIITT